MAVWWPAARQFSGAVSMAADPRKKAQPTRGANQARAPWREQAESYFIHHRKVARDSANRLLHTPVASLMTWTVMGVALALPVALLLLLSRSEERRVERV